MTSTPAFDPAAEAEAVYDMVWDHLREEVAANVSAELVSYPIVVRRLWDLYDGDREEMDDAVWRVGAELTDELTEELADDPARAVGWFYARINATAPADNREDAGTLAL